MNPRFQKVLDELALFLFSLLFVGASLALFFGNFQINGGM